MKRRKCLNNLVERLYGCSLFAGARSGTRRAGSAAVVAAIIGAAGVGVIKPGLCEGGSYRDCKITFTSDRDGNDEIYIMNPDGSEQKRLTHAPANDLLPCWSPLLSSKTKEQQ